MKQGEVTDLIIEDGKVTGVVTKTHTCYRAESGHTGHRNLPRRKDIYRQRSLRQRP